ncbi:MAG: hypothetical protein CM1200mP20_13670 [Pseudomonadota bacterium]|nr:MAG: hypothetical protein CM1200mP20_13670 [Pseudomonadota bacterium]
MREELDELTAAQAEAKLLYDKTVALERESLLARRQAPLKKRIEVVEKESRDLQMATRSWDRRGAKIFFSEQRKELLRLKELGDPPGS